MPLLYSQGLDQYQPLGSSSLGSWPTHQQALAHYQSLRSPAIVNLPFELQKTVIKKKQTSNCMCIHLLHSSLKVCFSISHVRILLYQLALVATESGHLFQISSNIHHPCNSLTSKFWNFLSNLSWKWAKISNSNQRTKFSNYLKRKVSQGLLIDF